MSNILRIAWYILSRLYLYYRYLHSFPTRRSSDLHLHSFRHLAERGELAVEMRRFVNEDEEMCGGAVWFIGAGSSEEHKYELQSRLHNVCRLLLEKKNIKII